jgi:hypothetical protein
MGVIDADLLKLGDLFIRLRAAITRTCLEPTNILGHWVPFAWPRSPDTGPGLTPVGEGLVMQPTGAITRYRPDMRRRQPPSWPRP